MKEALKVTALIAKQIIGEYLIYLNDDSCQCIDLTCNAIEKQFNVRMNSPQLLCFTRELIISKYYRTIVYEYLRKRLHWNSIETEKCDISECDSFVININVKLKRIDLVMDKSWNSRVMTMVTIRFILEENLNWLSTIGGAYSSLGENDVQFAVRAGQTSLSQLRLACASADPTIVAKCGIYMVYSLCQRGMYKSAHRLIKHTVYPYISKIINCDNVLKNMYKAACYRVRVSKSMSISTF